MALLALCLLLFFGIYNKRYGLKGFIFMFKLIKRVFADCGQSENGDYDPARVFGYGFVVLSGTVFLGLTIYETMTTSVFNTEKFSMGVVAISSAIAGAAAGVFIKRSTEIPLSVSSTVTSTSTNDSNGNEVSIAMSTESAR